MMDVGENVREEEGEVGVEGRARWAGLSSGVRLDAGAAQSQSPLQVLSHTRQSSKSSDGSVHATTLMNGDFDPAAARRLLK